MESLKQIGPPPTRAKEFSNSYQAAAMAQMLGWMLDAAHELTEIMLAMPDGRDKERLREILRRFDGIVAALE